MKKSLLFLALLSLPLFGQFTNAKKIHGRPIDSAAPQDGYTLIWSAAQSKYVIAAPPGAGGGLGDPAANGIVKRTAPGATSIATNSDVLSLWTGTCSASTYLRGDGACSSVPAAGLADPGSNGLLKRTALNTTAVVISSDVIGLWTGTCDATSYLRGDGSCATPAGGGSSTPNYQKSFLGADATVTITAAQHGCSSTAIVLDGWYTDVSPSERIGPMVTTLDQSTRDIVWTNSAARPGKLVVNCSGGGGGGGGGTWGSITGTLSDQTDLQTALSTKAPATSGTSPLKGNGSGGFSSATASDIAGLFTGSGYLKSDGTAGTPSGGGDCTSTLAAGTDQFGAPAAGSVVCVTGNQILTAAVSIANANVTIRCAPGVTITRQTAATNGFDWTGNNGSMVGCTLATGNVNNGVLLNLNASGFTGRDITVTGTGNNGTSVASAWILTTGGTDHYWNNLRCGTSSSAITNNCIKWDSTSSAISAVRVNGVYVNMDYDISVSSHPAAIGVYNETGKQTQDFDFNNIQCYVHGSCFAIFEGSGTTFPVNIRVNNLAFEYTVGNQSNPIAGFNIYGCDRCQFTNLSGIDNGRTHFNAPLHALHDMHDFIVQNIKSYVTANSGQCVLALDSARGSIGPGHCGGAKTTTPGSVATSGWATTLPGLAFQNSASGAEEDEVNIHDFTFLVPPSHASDVIQVYCLGAGAASCNHAKVVNNTIYGSGTVAAGIGIHFKYGGSAATHTYGFIAGNHISNIQTGITIDANVANAFIGENILDTVTTALSNAGTSTRIHYTGGLPYATWNTSVANGSMGLCTDCTISACSSAGSGAFIRYAAGAPVCW